MSLANVARGLAGRASSLVLLGDPQQLEQPQKGSHPDGVDVSALAAHPRRASDDAARTRIFLAGDVAAGAGDLRVHVGGVLRGQACTRSPDSSARRSSAPAVRRRRPVGRRRRARRVSAMRRTRRSRSVAAHRRATARARRRRWTDRLESRAHAPLTRRRHPRRRAVQRAGRAAAGAARPRGVARRHGRQVPGPGSAGRDLLDGDVAAGGRAARHGVPVQSQSPQRRDVARASAPRSSSPVPRLFEPECRTPRQMQLANALCRYREMAALLSAYPTP